MEKYCYLNGSIILEKKAGVSLRDLGVLRGFGVFEVLIAQGEKLFLASDHYRRFKNSAQELGLKIPLSEKELEAVLQKIIRKNKFKSSIIRYVLTGGISPNGFAFKQKPTFFIIVDEGYELPVNFYKKGIKLITQEHQREFPRAKTLNYVRGIVGQQELKKKGALEMLYVSRGKVLEAITSNFFIFKKDTLITPLDNILLGTTRNFVLKIARRRFKVEERDLTIKELKKASEAFITATIKGIIPVTKVDGNKIGQGQVGKNTQWLMQEFEINFQKEIEKK